MAETGCLYTIAAIFGLAVMVEANWTFFSMPVAVLLGITTAVVLGWFLTDHDKPDDNDEPDDNA